MRGWHASCDQAHQSKNRASRLLCASGWAKFLECFKREGVVGVLLTFDLVVDAVVVDVDAGEFLRGEGGVQFDCYAHATAPQVLNLAVWCFDFHVELNGVLGVGCRCYDYLDFACCG